MPNVKHDDAKMEREMRAESWRIFRKNNFLTQRRLAELLNISRRTVQKVEAAAISPHPETLRRFALFKRDFHAHSDLNLQE